MQLASVDTDASQSDLHRAPIQFNEQTLMTPARRAALDALEQEFRELLKSPVR